MPAEQLQNLFLAENRANKIFSFEYSVEYVFKEVQCAVYKDRCYQRVLSNVCSFPLGDTT